jgi:hypothetical protein
MSEGSSTARLNARRVAILLAIGCIVWALIVWLRRREAVVVLITADQPTIGAGGQTHVDAALVRSRTRTPIESKDCKFRWSTTMGEVVGSGSSVVWNAPSIPEASATISVIVRCEDDSLRGTIDLATESTRVANTLSERHYGSDPTPVAAIAQNPTQKHEGDDAPIIDEITLEKTELCRGEDDLVTVKSHDPKTGEATWIRTNIGGQSGTAVPLLYNVEVRDPPYKIAVTGNYGRGITYADVPHVTLLDCDTPWRVAVTFNLIPNTEDDFHFAAKVIPKPGGAKFDACSYEWDFGDENGKSTTEPFSEHSYLNRPQVGLDVEFLVQVKLVACDGSGIISGRIGLTLTNTYALQKVQKHLSGLIIVGDPRYPQRGDDDIVRQTALFRTFESSPVTITKLAYVDTVAGVVSDPTAMSVSSFLGTNTISGEWTRVPLTYDTSSNPSWQMRRWDLEGTAADGDKVVGSFTLMNPPKKLDRDKSPKITDPVMKERIMAAMKILGKDHVSEEDLLALEEQGKIPKLKHPEDHIPRPPPPATVQPLGSVEPPPPNKQPSPPFVPSSVASEQAAGTSKEP